MLGQGHIQEICLCLPHRDLHSVCSCTYLAECVYMVKMQVYTIMSQHLVRRSKEYNVTSVFYLSARSFLILFHHYIPLFPATDSRQPSWQWHGKM